MSRALRMLCGGIRPGMPLSEHTRELGTAVEGLAKTKGAHKGINPFTKQQQMFKAKPARRVIKVRALKALKDMAK